MTNYVKVFKIQIMSIRQINNLVNKSLQDTLKTYFILKQKGRDKLANAVLSYGSTMADFLITNSGLRKTYSSEGMTDPELHEQLTQEQV